MPMPYADLEHITPLKQMSMRRTSRPMPLSVSSIMRAKLTPDAEFMIIALVGLPARGKSFISKKLERYLAWRGDTVQIFNVGVHVWSVRTSVRTRGHHSECCELIVMCFPLGERRRKEQTDGAFHDASFFSAGNRSKREELAHGVLLEMLDWLRAKDAAGTRVAIFDATNSTTCRRKVVDDAVKANLPQCKLLFVESVGCSKRCC